jgi:hypothetical protein
MILVTNPRRAYLLFLQDLSHWTGTLKDSTMKKEVVAFGGTLAGLRRTIPTFIHLDDVALGGLETIHLAHDVILEGLGLHAVMPQLKKGICTTFW